MDKVISIISIVVFIVSLVSSILSFIISKYKRKGELEQHKSSIQNAENAIKLIKEIVPKAVENAEKMNMSGENKKLLAISKIMIECSSNKIDYSSNAEFINECIESLIGFSKLVNKNRGV